MKIQQDSSRTQEKLVDAYKQAIAAAYKELKHTKDLQFSQQHHKLAKSLRTNPYLLLILDDMAAFFSDDIQRSEIIRKIAFQGRHLKITT